MNATKTTYQKINGELVQWTANGSLPALLWTDDSGNNWRVIGSYQFDNNNENYSIVVSKYVMPIGTTEWIYTEQYILSASTSTFRILATGQLIPSVDGIPSAINDQGVIVDPMGWVYSGKYFTIGIGYNPTGAKVSINYWIYLEMADTEGLIIIN